MSWAPVTWVAFLICNSLSEGDHEEFHDLHADGFFLYLEEVQPSLESWCDCWGSVAKSCMCVLCFSAGRLPAELQAWSRPGPTRLCSWELPGHSHLIKKNRQTDHSAPHWTFKPIAFYPLSPLFVILSFCFLVFVFIISGIFSPPGHSLVSLLWRYLRKKREPF